MFFYSENFDYPRFVYNEDCKLICTTDGFSGSDGDGDCSEILKEAINGKIIWED